MTTIQLIQLAAAILGASVPVVLALLGLLWAIMRALRETAVFRAEVSERLKQIEQALGATRENSERISRIEGHLEHSMGHD